MTAPASRDNMPLADDRPAHRGDVLVVEDTPASLKLLSDLLGAAGYRVRQAPDGALALWSATALPPELILLDIRMPGIDGFEVCRRLKAEPALAAIPVVFLSAQSDIDDKVRGFQAGAVDFIAKPYQPEEVLARVGAHIRLARTQQALAAANGELGDALAQLRAARLDAERARRLAALGALVAGVAHELNTPIGNGLLAASALDERTGLFMAALDAGVRRSALEQFGADTRHACALLLRSLERASGLIDRFKQVAADQGGCERRRFALGPLLGDLLAGARHDAQRVVLRLDIAAQARALDMDSFPGALGQVLLQLLRNALLHGLHEDGSGEIVIAVAPPHDGHVLLSVGDNGGGIAPASLDKIFEPFFTTRFGQGGGGLGLHIVHNLVVNVLGGSIAAESEPGRTHFLLRLPIRAPELGLEPSAPGAMSAMNGPV